jgi:hypothetical protein
MSNFPIFEWEGTILTYVTPATDGCYCWSPKLLAAIQTLPCLSTSRNFARASLSALSPRKSHDESWAAMSSIFYFYIYIIFFNFIQFFHLKYNLIFISILIFFSCYLFLSHSFFNWIFYLSDLVHIILIFIYFIWNNLLNYFF